MPDLSVVDCAVSAANINLLSLNHVFLHIKQIGFADFDFLAVGKANSKLPIKLPCCSPFGGDGLMLLLNSKHSSCTV